MSQQSIIIKNAITSLDNMLSGRSHSHTFACAYVKSTLAQIDGLSAAFESELQDAMNGCVLNIQLTATGALERLIELLIEFNGVGRKNDYCDHQLTVLAEYIATVVR